MYNFFSHTWSYQVDLPPDLSIGELSFGDIESRTQDLQSQGRALYYYTTQTPEYFYQYWQIQNIDQWFVHPQSAFMNI